MDKYIGRLLDNRYEILEVIGTGGMAVVYKARCHRLNRLVAIKILKDDYMDDEEFRRRFHSESQAVAMLSHPNIVSVYDVSSSITADYIVMELIDGITLKQYMEKKGVLNWKETLHFAIQIAKALEHAHGRGIVHRDIKPHNVMVLKNGSVKVTDFGIARMMSQSNTLTKEALGSVHYISPEQAKGGRVDSRSDIYSLGVVMYEMMSGRPPYDGESPVAVAIQHINGGAALPSTLNPNIPGGLEQIIMRAMAHEPAERYESASKMLVDMDEFRKEPAMLFDYNTPPMDDVINLKKTVTPEPELKVVPVSSETSEKKEPAVAAVPPRRTAASRAAAGAKTTSGSQRPRTGGTRSGTDGDRPVRRTGGGKQQKERRSSAAGIAIIACSVAILLAVGILATIFVVDVLFAGPELIEVPSFVGQDYETLKKNLDLDFELKVNNKEYSSEYPAGQIIFQNPAPGIKIAAGSVIAVDVSMGEMPEELKMPNVEGWSLEDATRALNNLGINKIEVLEENHDSIEKNKVIRTDPVAETILTADQKITLVVSLGMEHKIMQMPGNLIGQTEQAAKQILEDKKLNLEIVVEQIFDSKTEIGRVVKTHPEEGADIATDDTVTLYISKGPQLQKISNVLNLAVDSAVNILKNTDGFQLVEIVTVESEKNKDTVLELRVDDQVVKPNTEVDVSKTIVVVVSLGPAKDKEITKNVVIDLKDVPAEDDYDITVKRDGDVVYEEPVIHGTASITIREEKGSGKVTYTVFINDVQWKTHEEDFS